MENSGLLLDKTIIVTGANCGIGYETALDFATRGMIFIYFFIFNKNIFSQLVNNVNSMKGANVILACRDLKKAQEASDTIQKKSNNFRVQIELLDLASFKSIREFADRIISKHERLDILVNNAGLNGAPFAKTIDGFETHFQINYLGEFLKFSI